MSDSVSATGVAPAQPTLVSIAPAPLLDAEGLDVYGLLVRVIQMLTKLNARLRE